MRALKIAEDRSVKLPVEVGKIEGFGPGDRIVPVREGRAVVLVPLVDFEATRGIAQGSDYYATYRERGARR